MQGDLKLSKVAAALGESGLSMLGAFHPDAGDEVPPLADGRPTATLVIAGNIGEAMWRAFETRPPPRRT